MGYWPATKGKEISPFVTIWMDLEATGQMEEDKHYLLSLVCGMETSSQIQRTDWGLSGVGGRRVIEMGEGIN